MMDTTQTRGPHVTFAPVDSPVSTPALATAGPAAAPTQPTGASTPYDGPDGGRIDVHAHFFPPAYRRGLADAGITAAGDIPIPQWTPDLAIDFMDRHGIAAQVVSIPDPALTFVSGGPARTLARTVNEYTAELVRSRPTRFGALGPCPCPTSPAQWRRSPTPSTSSTSTASAC